MSSNTNSIGIDKLRFFTGDGREIIMQKQYSCKWEIVPADAVYPAFMKNPSGHFELYPDNVLTTRYSDNQTVDGITYDMVTYSGNSQYVCTNQPIVMEPYHTYEITASGSNAKVIFDDGSTLSADLLSSETTFEFTREDYPNASGFTVVTLDTAYEFTEKSNLVCVAVDEPGLINDTISFARKSCDKDEILDTTLLSEIKNGTELTGIYDGSSDAYTELTGTSLTHTLDSVFDIIFFSYRYTIDDTEYFLQNTLKITINTGAEIAVQEYNLVDFLSTSQDRAVDCNLVKYNSWNQTNDFLAVSDNTSDSYLYGVAEDLFTQVLIKDSDFYEETDTTLVANQTSAIYTMEANVNENQFPYVKYVGTVYQDKVSTNFIAATTVIIVRDNGTGTNPRYEYPVISSDDVSFRLHFRFENNTEMSFITTNDNVNLEKTESVYALTSTEVSSDTNTLHFTVGFESGYEGCYCNTMGMFIRNEDTDEDFFAGVIRFMTEVEDEDERFRTLFTNFGIPDPIKYPNIFKEQDPDEEGTDWTLVNKKSKELFLYYDEIFPYVGTYKALFNAIKFLGYQDVIFKEWYKIKDQNENNKFVAIQNYDTSSGVSIASMLKKYGVEYGEYERYTKLNRLSMVYHINEIDEDNAEERVNLNDVKSSVYCFEIGTRKLYLPNTGDESSVYGIAADKNGIDDMWKDVTVRLTTDLKLKVIDGYFYNTEAAENVHITEDDNCYLNSLTHLDVCVDDFISGSYEALTATTETISQPSEYYNNEDIVSLKEVYEYRTDEVISKLYSVKQWLERYITGVNCYISDINGEYVVLERIKTVGYVTEHEFKDFYNEGKFTPHCSQKTTFEDSSAIITCSLNEFVKMDSSGNFEESSGVCFEDYEDYPIERFIKFDTSVSTEDGDVTVYVSAPLSSLSVADEYQFKLNLDDASSGSLYEFTDSSDLDNPIVVNDGEITFWDQNKPISRIDYNELPIIQMRKGNIRNVYGSWSADNLVNSNVIYSVFSVQDADGNVNIKMEDVQDNSYVLAKGTIALSPHYTSIDVPSTGMTVAETVKALMNVNYVTYTATQNSSSIIMFTANEPGEAEEPTVDVGTTGASMTIRVRTRGANSALATLESSYADVIAEGLYIKFLNKISNVYDYYRLDTVKDYTSSSSWTKVTQTSIPEDSVDDVLNMSANGATFTLTGTKQLVYLNVSGAPTASGTIEISLNGYRPEFLYTSENVWQLPLFFMSGYKFVGTEDEIYFAKDQVVEIIEGELKFHNHYEAEYEKYCNAAEIFFADSAHEEQSGEQVIGINYSYESERTPIYKFDMVSAFKNSSALSKVELFKRLHNHIEIFNNVDIPVNRLGNYQVIVKAYDAYNNIFTNKSDDILTICTKMPGIDVILNSENSNNNVNFYRFNTSPEAMDEDVKTELLANVDTKATFPVNYKIYSAEHLMDSSSIYYDNISYALDTPKANDYMVLTNLTEQVYSTDVSNNMLVLNMKSNNPRKQNIYIENGQINLCIYDDNTQEILFQTQSGLAVSGVVEPSNSRSSRIYADGQLTIDNISIPDNLLEQVNNHTNNINMYVINATEVDISGVEEIENDTTNRIAFIPMEDHSDSHMDSYVDMYEENYSADEMLRHFPVDTMIKVSMSITDSSMVKKMLSETAYRILDTSIVEYDNGDDTTVQKCGYVIDGNIYLDYIRNFHNSNIYYKDSSADSSNNTYLYSTIDVSIVMKPLNTKPVQYNLRVSHDALESVYVYGDYEYYAMYTQVQYNSRQLLFDSYFDDSYAASVMSYDPMTLNEIWDSSVQERFADASLYVYTDYPVTIDQNRAVIVKPNSDITQIEDGFKNHWTWKVMTLEDNSNWPERESKVDWITLFESTNNNLTVKPYMLGSQSIELQCIDKYGNMIQNTGGGNIYVKESSVIQEISNVKRTTYIDGEYTSSYPLYYTCDTVDTEDTADDTIYSPDAVYFSFSADYELANHGKGKLLAHYTSGNIEYIYRTFYWSQDSNQDINIVYRSLAKPRVDGIYNFQYGNASKFDLNELKLKSSAGISWSNIDSSANFKYYGFGELTI